METKTTGAGRETRGESPDTSLPELTPRASRLTPALIEELRALPQWVLWKYEVKAEGKKPTKVPYEAWGNRASSTRPGTWTTWKAVSEAFRGGDYAGVGFVVYADDPYCGLDLDQALGEDGTVLPWAARIVAHFNSYTEVTPSGQGLRIWIRAALPGPGRMRSGPDGREIGVYDRGRYFTVTGEQLPGTPNHAEERQEALLAFLAQYFPDPEPVPEPSTPETDAEPFAETLPPDLARELGNAGHSESRGDRVARKLSDQELLEKMFAASNGHTIYLLYQGEWKAAGYPSQSEADLALCAHLRWWTKDDPAWIDRLLRDSGLYREKWDEKRGAKTYGHKTTDFARQGPCDGYKGGKENGTGKNGHGSLKQKEHPEGTNAQEQAPEDGPEEPTWRTFTFEDFAAMRFEDTQFVVDRLIREGVNLFMGKTGDGKTWFSIDLAIAVATGGKALGHRSVIQGNVLYLAFEESRAEMFQRLLQIRDEDTDDQHFPSLEIACTSDDDWPMTSTGTILRALTQWLESRPNPRLVVFDPLLGYIAQSNPNSAVVQADYNLIRNLRQVARAHPGVAFLIHDHRSKAAIGGGREAQDTGVHSTGLIAAADNRLTLQREEGNIFKLHVRGRMVPNAELRLHFDPGLGSWEVKEDARSLRQSDVGVAIVRALKEAAPGALHSSVIADQLSLTRGTVKGRLFRLQKAGIVTAKGSGFYSFADGEGG